MEKPTDNVREEVKFWIKEKELHATEEQIQSVVERIWLYIDNLLETGIEQMLKDEELESNAVVE